MPSVSPADLAVGAFSADPALADRPRRSCAGGSGLDALRAATAAQVPDLLRNAGGSPRAAGSSGSASSWAGPWAAGT